MREVTHSGGLERGLSDRQMTMIGLGGAIGTGLFLGSTLAISTAGPGVIVCYLAGAAIAMVVAWALIEMTVVHPTRGSFGAITQRYLGPWAGFVSRWTYWTCQIVAIGGEVVAAGIYMQYWWPSLPVWVSAIGFSLILLGVNALTVRWFGEAEFWFASIKIVAIVVFLVLGLLYVFVGLPGGHDSVGLHNLTSHGGFFPTGIVGLWSAMIVVIFSFVGVEVISVTAAEAKEPERSLPKAIRAMVARLTLFYLLAMLIIVAIVPWNQAGAHEGILYSPFVRVFDTAGIPGAAGIMNFVILTAALSSMNTNLYLTTRMAHSLAHDGLAPRIFGAVTKNGVPGAALVISAIGLGIATYLSVRSPDKAYFWLFGISIFGALVVWMLILATLVAFRRVRAREGLPPSPVRLPGVPWVPVATILALVGILLAAFEVELSIAWKTGVPFLIVLSAAYWIVARRRGGVEPALELGESTTLTSASTPTATARPSVSTES
jgi:L-asparagine transporter-like permease